MSDQWYTNQNPVPQPTSNGGFQLGLPSQPNSQMPEWMIRSGFRSSTTNVPTSSSSSNSGLQPGQPINWGIISSPTVPVPSHNYNLSSVPSVALTQPISVSSSSSAKPSYQQSSPFPLQSSSSSDWGFSKPHQSDSRTLAPDIVILDAHINKPAISELPQKSFSEDLEVFLKIQRDAIDAAYNARIAYEKYKFEYENMKKKYPHNFNELRHESIKEHRSYIPKKNIVNIMEFERPPSPVSSPSSPCCPGSIVRPYTETLSSRGSGLLTRGGRSQRMPDSHFDYPSTGWFPGITPGAPPASVPTSSSSVFPGHMSTSVPTSASSSSSVPRTTSNANFGLFPGSMSTPTPTSSSSIFPTFTPTSSSSSSIFPTFTPTSSSSSSIFPGLTTPNTSINPFTGAKSSVISPPIHIRTPEEEDSKIIQQQNKELEESHLADMMAKIRIEEEKEIQMLKLELLKVINTKDRDSATKLVENKLFDDAYNKLTDAERNRFNLMMTTEKVIPYDQNEPKENLLTLQLRLPNSNVIQTIVSNRLTLEKFYDYIRQNYYNTEKTLGIRSFGFNASACSPTSTLYECKITNRTALSIDER